jgi:hypothetical protein
MDKKQIEVSGKTPSKSYAGFRSAKAVARDLGIGPVTLWRMARRGWILTVNICGRPYVDLVSLADFYRRAASGEFARPPAGAAARAANARKEAQRDSESQPAPTSSPSHTKPGKPRVAPK